MTKMMLLLALPILPGLVAFASAGAADRAATQTGAASIDSVRCEVRVSKAPGGIELEAVVAADRKASGVYRFVIEKRGSGGRSMVSQDGDFSLAPGREEVVGAASLGLERGASYTARVSLENGRGKTLCEAEQST